MPFNLKQSIEVMKRNEKNSTSSIYRALINGILHHVDALTFGNSNAEALQKNYSEILDACKSK